MTPKLQETSCGTACRLHADVLPHLKAGPVVAAAEHTVLGHEVWKGSLKAHLKLVNTHRVKYVF